MKKAMKVCSALTALALSLGLCGTTPTPQTRSTGGIRAYAAGNATTDKQTDSETGLTYRLQDGKASILGGDSTRTEIVIPAELGGCPVTFISANAFGGYTALTTVTIPASVTYISYDAFYGCTALKAYIVAEENEAYSAVDGVLCNADKTKLYAYPNGKPETSYNVPDGIVTIGDGAFYQAPLTEIILPETVETLGYSAFSDCKQLTTLILPQSLRNINDHAFSGCSALKSLTVPSQVQRIGNEAFEGCSGLTEITFQTRTAEIGAGLFWDCNSLKEIYAYSGSTIAKYVGEDKIIPLTLSGDMNGDGIVSVADLVALARFVAQDVDFAATADTANTAVGAITWDYNGDGLVDSTDISALSRYLVNLA